MGMQGLPLGDQIQGVRAWQRDGVAAAALTAFACWAPTFPDALLLGFARLAALLALAGCTSLAAQAAQTLQACPHIQLCLKTTARSATHVLVFQAGAASLKQ